MKAYSLYLRREAIDSLRLIRPKVRQGIAGFIDSLAADPFTRGDFQEKDETGRDLEIKIIGNYAITFWVDHAVQEVKIVDIIPADVG
jgi:hypothetical protein